jgi:hypothetical protein
MSDKIDDQMGELVTKDELQLKNDPPTVRQLVVENTSVDLTERTKEALDDVNATDDRKALKMLAGHPNHGVGRDYESRQEILASLGGCLWKYSAQNEHGKISNYHQLEKVLEELAEATAINELFETDEDLIKGVKAAIRHIKDEEDS